MPKIPQPLTKLQLDKISKKQGRHAVGGVTGLYLWVRNNSRSWILRVQGKKTQNERTNTDIGLGSYTEVTLSEARDKARALREEYKKDSDYFNNLRASRLPQKKEQMFEDFAEIFIQKKRVEFRNKKHGDQWESTFKRHVYPHIGKKPIGSITKFDIEQILKPIWDSIPETARRLRGRIEQVFHHAEATDVFAD